MLTRKQFYSNHKSRNYHFALFDGRSFILVGMIPTSGKVKLNRVALKDVTGLKVVPRRRRVPKSSNNVTAGSTNQEENHVSEVGTVRDPAPVPPSNGPLQTHQVDPEHVTGTTGAIPDGNPEVNCVGTKNATKKKYFQSLKREGPYTRGRYRQSKPITSRQSRSDHHRELSKPTDGFIWCLCTHSEGGQCKRTQVKAGARLSQRSCEIGPGSAAPQTPRNKAPWHPQCGAGRRREPRHGDSNCRPVGGRVADSRRDRSREEAGTGSTGCDPPPAADTRPVRLAAASASSGLSNIGKYEHPSPTGFAGAEGALRRAVGASCCGLCGDSKYISWQQKMLHKQGQKTSSPELKQSTNHFNIQIENPVTIGKYPKVTLCDISQKCDTCSHNCSYVLLDVLKTKVVHCFKQDMRTGFRFGPVCSGRKKNECEKSALAKNSELCPRIQPEDSMCRSQSLAGKQQNMKACADAAKTLSSRTTCHFFKACTSETSEASTTSSASLLLGKRINSRECRTSTWDRVVEGQPGPGCDLIGAEIGKRFKPGESISNKSLTSAPDFESIRCNVKTKTDCIEQDETCSWMSDGSQSCLQFDSSAVKENSVHKKPYYQVGDPQNPDSEVSPELCSQNNELDTDNPESLTCQRVRPYFRKRHFSCARTYMSWPFSNNGRTLTAHAGTTVCPGEPRANNDSPVKQNQAGLQSSRINDRLPNAPRYPSSDSDHKASCEIEEKQDGESVVVERNGKINGNMSSDSKNAPAIAPHFLEDEKLLASPLSDTATCSTPSQCEREPDTVSASSVPLSGPESNNCMSTPSPSALGLTDSEPATTLSPVAFSFAHGGLSSLSATRAFLPPSSFLPKKGTELFYFEETQMASCSCSSTYSSEHNLDSLHSSESSLLLPQDEQHSDEEILTERTPPKLEPYFNSSDFNHDHPGFSGKDPLYSMSMTSCVETNSNEFMLLPVLSPVTSPRGLSRTGSMPKGSSEEEGLNQDLSSDKMFPGHHMPQDVNGNHHHCDQYHHQLPPGQHCNEALEGVTANSKTLSSPRFLGDENGGNEEKSQDKDDVEQSNRCSTHDPLDTKIKTALTSGVPTALCCSPNSDEDDGDDSIEGHEHFAGEEESSPSEIEGNERVKAEAEEADDSEPGILDELTAYEQDILLVDVIQDDPELFENLPEQSLLKLGPTRVSEAPKATRGGVTTPLTKLDGASLEFEQRLTPVNLEFHCNSPETTEESKSRPWRPRCSSATLKTQDNKFPAIDHQTRNMGQPDANNNHVNGVVERSQPVLSVNSLHRIPHLTTIRSGPWITNSVNTAEFRCQKSNAYCRQYFSESQSCGFKMCWFQHVPVEGDEKFCVETVLRFIKNPICLQKAGAVFTGYYQNSPPGVYFSIKVLLSLLWALLKAGMVSDICSVLNVSVAHKIVPNDEFLLALFTFVREKGLMSFVPELLRLTFKMASAGLGLSLDCLDCVKNTPEFQQIVCPSSPVSVSGNHKLATSAYLNLALSIVQIEFCTKQEDWRQMGEVFRSICHFSQHPNQVERISGRIAIALLSESKDKLSMPFAAFAETVCQNASEDSLSRTFLGRIGVSLMLRYHKTHQWAKGRRVVEVLSVSKVHYTTLKGLFGNEDGASRCCLVTVAAELFLLSGSTEGALNTLRENKWFLDSSLWPCEPADLESRSRILMHLAAKTSHRDTLEVLCNLPGVKEPNDMIDISRYSPLFNSHLQVCVDRHVLPVASDTVDFMLSKNLPVERAVLQILLQKLGKQNLWLRAREVFRHSLRTGYYSGVSAPPGHMAMIVPCGLVEVELALTFEMFITVNATVVLQLSETTTSCLSITLKRSQSNESDYLSAGSRLFSAACIPQPKLNVHYTAVNSSQEQVFILDMLSARRWLRHNHLWANEMWMQ